MRRFPPIALLALLLGVVLAGCGSDGPDGSPAEVLAAATKQTQDAKSSRVAIDVSTAGAQPVRVTGEGVFDYAGKGTLSLDLPFGENGTPSRVESIIDGERDAPSRLARHGSTERLAIGDRRDDFIVQRQLRAVARKPDRRLHLP